MSNKSPVLKIHLHSSVQRWCQRKPPPVATSIRCPVPNHLMTSYVKSPVVNYSVVTHVLVRNWIYAQYGLRSIEGNMLSVC